MALQSLTDEEVDIPGITAFVCLLMDFEHPISLKQDTRSSCVSGGKGQDLQAILKKINFVSLPPCANTLLNHIKSSICSYNVEELTADETSLTGEASPTDYGS